MFADVMLVIIALLLLRLCHIVNTLNTNVVKNHIEFVKAAQFFIDKTNREIRR